MMNVFRTYVYVVLFVVVSPGLMAQKLIPLPDGLKTQWDAVPVENLGGEHEVMVINGLWRFQPGEPKEDITTATPKDQWSHMWIPGSWHTRPFWNETGLVADGTSPLWKRYIQNHREWPIGWFERDITLPATWDGRAVFVEFSEISTRAQVWLDGNWCGALQEKKGRVELTEYIRPGTTQTLRVQVLAVPPEEPVLVLMGETTEQILLKPAKLSKFGLVWDVELVSEPKGPNLTGLRLNSSVTDERFSISGALDEAIPEGRVRLSVQVEDLEGKVLQAWAEQELRLEEEKRFTWSKDWIAERLWDTDDPYLMKARIKATGDGWSDERLVRFGFREFEIRGKEFYLNGKAIRLRPTPHVDTPQIEEVVKQWMRGIKSIGFNMKMTEENRSPETMIKMADELGMLMFVELPEIKDYVVRDRWEENKEDWQRRMSAEMTRLYNHPSIVMWWSGFNVFAHGEDQNPARIGQSEAMMIKNPEWERRIRIGQEAMDMIRAEDPSRGVYSHNGSIVGDLQTTNVYLCLIPLQEREEWLSDWAEHGDLPFLACEFGLPLDNTFMQGRAGGGWTTLGQGKNAKGSANSAMMLTEYAAIYLGPEAYKLQSEFYADGIVESHFEGFIHDRNAGLGGWDSDKVDPLQRMIKSEAYQKIQVLFNENSFRSWRAYGMTGGVNPWSFQNHTHNAISWRKNQDNMSLGPFKPGTRGKYRPEISRGLYYNVMEGGWPKLPAYHALVPNNQELLAYIGGDADQGFTDKDHQFFSGDLIAKQAVFINDRRHAVAFKASWQMDVDGERIAEGVLSKKLEPGKNGFEAFQAELPHVQGKRSLGRIHLKVEADGVTLEDEFSFRIYPMSRPEPVQAAAAAEKAGFWGRLFGSRKKPKVSTSGAQGLGSPVMLLEGDGSTREWLQQVGSPIQAWDSSSTQPLFLGRGALEGSAVDLSSFRDWVKDGGVLVISSPSPEWVSERLGLRITPHPSRRVFPTAQPHPMTQGLDNEDLRDWNASSSTVEGYPEYSSTLHVSGDKPTHGWRWGNRGSVASYMMEKPHHAAWSPIFEGEFDLAYSPLMELSVGKGRVILSTFDLEDNVGVTPAALILGRRLVDYAARMHGKAEPRGKVAYVGTGPWEYIFGRMGVRMAASPEKANVLVLGPGHAVSDPELQELLSAGKQVLMLRGAELPAFSGWSWDQDAANFYGSTEVPTWPETAMLSISDFHSRAPYAFWRLKGGEGLAAEGMLARKKIGEGTLIATAFDPTSMQTDEKPYMRLTRWRHSRNLVSLISAMGGDVELNKQIFDLQPLPTGKISLDGPWKLKWVTPMPAAKKPGLIQDPGMSAAAKTAIMENAEQASGWLPYAVPSDADITYPKGGAIDGELVLQKTIHIPASWAKEELTLDLGRVDDHDVTFWNGKQVGSIAAEHPKAWSALRIYQIPAEQVQPGENTISVRVMDLFGGSGISSKSHPTNLIRPNDKNLQFYHPDYRLDWAYGDDAYRYYRW